MKNVNKLVWFIVLVISALAYGDRVHIKDGDVKEEIKNLQAIVGKDKKRVVGPSKATAIMERLAKWDANIPEDAAHKDAFLAVDDKALLRMFVDQSRAVLAEIQLYSKERDALKADLKKNRNMEWEPFDVEADAAINAENLYLRDWRAEILSLLSAKEDKDRNAMLAKTHMIRLLQKMNQDRILLSYGKQMLTEFVKGEPNALYKGKTDAAKRLIAIGMAQATEQITSDVRRNFVVQVGGKNIYDASNRTNLPVEAYQAFIDKKDGVQDPETLLLGQEIIFNRHVPEVLRNYQDWNETKAAGKQGAK